MKGIILAGGTGSRLAPLTQSISKHLLPVYDKPMVYYPLSVLMLSGIREIVMIITPEHKDAYAKMLGDGTQWGLEISYVTQSKPNGLGEAFQLAEPITGKAPVCLILGDNFFWGHGFSDPLKLAATQKHGASLFACQVKNPENFGVVFFNQKDQPIEIIEKPVLQKSTKLQYAVTGLYFYDAQVFDFAQELTPSPRDELEITDINSRYLEQGSLHVERLGRGFAWMDMGTPERLYETAQFVETVQQRRGYMIAALEEIAWQSGWISTQQLMTQAETMKNTAYGHYLQSLV